MTDLPYVYAALVFLLAGLAAVVVHSRRRFGFRAAGLAAAFVALVAAYAGLSDVLSRAKPVAWEVAGGGVEGFEVLFADVPPGGTIHLLLRAPGADEPRLYALPWSAQIATQLERALAETETAPALLRASEGLFENDVEDRERIFYAAPVPALPRKDWARFEPAPFVPDESNTMFGAGEPDG